MSRGLCDCCLAQQEAGLVAVESVQPAVPDGAETIAFGSNGRVDALVSRDSGLADYTLDVRDGRWELAQVINVPIQYGSSS